MTEQLTLFFDRLTPVELDSLLDDSFEKEPLPRAALSRVKGKALSGIAPRRSVKLALRYTAAALLAVILGGAALTLPFGRTIDPVVPVDPTPIPSEYDAFSDPNVLWGENDSSGYISEFNFLESGKVIISPLLQKTINSAGDENLIAFIVEPTRSCYSYQHVGHLVKVDELAIHEELDPNGELRALVAHYLETGEDYAKVQGYFQEYSTNWSRPDRYVYESLQYIAIRLQSEYPIEDFDFKTLGYDDYQDFLWSEALTRALQSETFVAAYEQVKYYYGFQQNFRYSWIAQEIRAIREQLIEYGFIPVYSEEKVNQAQYADLPYISYENKSAPPGSSPIVQYESLMLLFVATPEQISQFEQLVAEENDRSYYLWSSNGGEQYFMVRLE